MEVLQHVENEVVLRDCACLMSENSLFFYFLVIKNIYETRITVASYGRKCFGACI